jgi:putative ABC transport system permease protein
MALPLSEAVAVSLGALQTNKVRSALTMLGIIIGVAAVIVMVALGHGAERAVKERIQKLGSNLLYVRPGSGQRGGGGINFGAGSARIDMGDYTALREQVASATALVPDQMGNAQLQWGTENYNTRVMGTTADYEWVRNGTVSSGRFFTNQENAARARVAIMGDEVRRELFADADPIGQDIKIKGTNFEVIGVLEAKGQSGWFNPDDMVLVPLETAQKRLFGNEYLSTITIKTNEEALLDQAALEVERALRREHKLSARDENDFQVRSQADVLATMTETTQTFGTLLFGVALVSLVVGGIGIMNIMLVSVTERTREIGVRKALGARRMDIRLQFLIEAVVLSVLGGGVGILLGIAGANLMARVAMWQTLVSGESVLVAFAASAAVGVFFGFYPAWRASALDPIEALRYE